MKTRTNILTKVCAICMTFLIFIGNANAETTNVAKVNDTYFSSIQAAIDASSTSDTVEILMDTTETQSISIDKGITINGNEHTIMAKSLSGTNAVFVINTEDKTVINNINIETNTRAVALNISKHDFTINGSNLKVGQRGITVNTNDNRDSVLNVNDCIIQNTNVSDYDKEVPGNDYRGISLWQYQDSKITIKNTTVEGFAYVINIAPMDYSYQGTEIIIDNSVLKGRAGLNIWGSNLKIDLTNSEIVGINNFGGSTEDFADIVLNSDADNNTLNIVNTKFTNYQNDVGLNNPNANQHMISVRSKENNISISGDASFIDSTKKLTSILTYSLDDAEDILTNKLEITGGMYSYDVKDFVPEGYESVLIDGMYHVKKIVKTPIIEIDELDPNVPVDKVTLGVTNTSKSEEILLDTLSTTNEVSVDDKNIKVTLEMSDIEVSSESQEKFKNLLKNATIVNYFDISINVIDMDSNSVIGKLTELKDKISFGIIIPNELINNDSTITRKYYILREHNDSIEILDVSLSDNGKFLEFLSDKFSTYALAYADEKIEQETPSEDLENNDETTIENPKTYDKIVTYLVINGISIVGAVGSILYLRNKINNIK
ncbi:MAG: hypothetical protein K2M17_05220 [Bacilli bacterium]|nr:hypothetical protein [Bacilli bacterium]